MAVDWSTNAAQERQAVTPRTVDARSDPRSTSPSLSPAAAPDAILTELNAARAEAQLWRSRYFDTLQELRDAQASLAACDKSHREWEAAYREVEMNGSLDAQMLEHYRLAVRLIAQGKLAQIPEALYTDAP